MDLKSLKKIECPHCHKNNIQPFRSMPQWLTTFIAFKFTCPDCGFEGKKVYTMVYKETWEA